MQTLSFSLMTFDHSPWFFFHFQTSRWTPGADCEMIVEEQTSFDFEDEDEGEEENSSANRVSGNKGEKHSL